jgi:hypothetical protein
MKTFRILTVAMAFFLTSSSFAQTLEAPEEERDVLVSVSAQVHDGGVYFNLSMINESKPGVYSLVRIHNDGTFHSVGMKEIAVNNINKPILYSFADKSVEDTSVSYKLVRISDETEVVKTWNCSEVANSICLEEALFAEN